MPPSALSPAFVLHARRYGDTSLLVELFGRELGRVACVAKGVLSAKRATVQLQPFQPLLIALRGRGEVQTLVAAESAGPAVALAGRQLYCGLYLNELVLKLTARADPTPMLYEDYGSALSRLGNEMPADPALRTFEIVLLQHLGHALVLDRDIDGLPIEPGARYTYLVESGPMRAGVGLDAPFSGHLFEALRCHAFNEVEIQREARVFMRAVLDHYLDGRAIRSRDLFR